MPTLNKNALRASLTGFLALGLLVAPMTAGSSAMSSANAVEASDTSFHAASTLSDPYTSQVYYLINQERAKVGAQPVRFNPSIANVSQDWANHLGQVTKDPNFNWNNIHRSDAGGSLIPRGATWYSEIVAFNFSAESIVQWWMNSPSHKAAMLDKRVTDIGIGVVIPTSGPYAGWHQVVANFGAYPGAPVPARPSYVFNDISASPFIKEVTWMKTSGISTGYGDGTYRPYETVKRDAMAAFIYRMAGSPAYTPPRVSPFADITPSTQFYKEMTWMRSMGLSTGYPDGTYRPLNAVNRDAMAAFMKRFAGSYCGISQASGYRAPASTFADNPNGPFRTDIEWLRSTGISTGYGDNTYRPLDAVTRESMAAFMYRLNGYVAQNGGCR